MARDELARGRQLTAAARALLKKSPRLTTEAALDRLDDYTTQLETEEHDMPAKGARAMGVDTTPVGVRLPRDLVAQIDAQVKRMRREHPDLPITRAHAVSHLIRRGLAADVTDTVTDTPQPPVAPKPVKARRPHKKVK